MSLSRSVFLLGLSTVLLAGCGELREDLGLGRNVPDEFAVVDRPPLALPPDFTLRPPRPGAPRPQSVDTDHQASVAVFGRKISGAQDRDPSTAEKALLEASGAVKTDSTIREIVDRESAQKVVASEHLVRRLLDWSNNESSGTTVDAAAEAERIRKAKENNEPLSSGATPVIERQESGWLGF